ncbi:rRNA adenine N-6-methyltransferase family protein [Streptomyces griseoluteus]|uniref:rRNA adenine N-6-methyltransferase family protein n=1 Tax=Streptomyces griseoluteus TaxID=29306 RepID=UPI0037FC8DBC
MTPDWERAALYAPRADYLPQVIWVHDSGSGESERVDRLSEPDIWDGYACADTPIVTQWADDKPASVPASMSPQPSAVFRMLAALGVQPGNRVLEIGTGTGWTAGLLAARLGDQNVTSIEIDPGLANAARNRLGLAGLLGTVLTRDGILGDPAGAPFHRVIATASVGEVPAAWIEQTREGGLIVVPWGTHYSSTDAIVRLEVASGQASGRFVGPAQFMKLRAQRLKFAGREEYVPDCVEGAEHGKAAVTAEQLLGEGRRDGGVFTQGLRVRDCYRSVAVGTTWGRPVWFFGLTDRSWACVVLQAGRQADVWQSGPRRLWDEVWEARGWWEDAGRPGIERFGLTVRSDGSQLAWLDDPENAWPV